jgi:serine/threonine-protein kinase
VTVVRDSRGALVEFAVVPSRRQPDSSGSPDFSTFLEDAEAGSLTSVPPEWSAPFDSDSNAAWIERESGRRIEAAARGGRVVWFSVLPEETPRSDAAQGIQQIAFIGLMIAIPAATVLLALRNLRQGRGDRRGAIRVAGTVFALLLVAMLLRKHHVPAFREEWLIVSETVAVTAFWAGMVWLGYIALEPFVRKRWPRMLISWSRLLDGRWRDPMVGRDLLIGSAAGALIAMTAHATALAGSEPLRTAVSVIGSPRQIVCFVLFHAAEAVGRALFAAVLLVAMRAIVRRLDLAILISSLLIAASNAAMPGGPLWLRLIWLPLVGASVYLILFRYGLLALAMTAFTFLTLRNLPLTVDPSSWYFSSSLFVYALVIALMLVGFRYSLGARKVLPQFSLD